jgi:hypothetical protein
VTAVTGDPASCSHLGGSLRRLAADLRVTGRHCHEVFDSAFDDPASRRHPVLRAARRRVEVLDAATAAAARELDTVGTALQSHASELAEALAALRDVVSRAERAGLQVRGSVLTPAWGVSGVADHAALAAQEATRSTLQSELDHLLSLLASRRQRLCSTLRSSTEVLARHAAAVRR